MKKARFSKLEKKEYQHFHKLQEERDLSNAFLEYMKRASKEIQTDVANEIRQEVNQRVHTLTWKWILNDTILLLLCNGGDRVLFRCGYNHLPPPSCTTIVYKYPWDYTFDPSVITNDILCHIMSFLSIEDKTSCLAVSTQWNRVAKRNLLWLPHWEKIHSLFLCPTMLHQFPLYRSVWIAYFGFVRNKSIQTVSDTAFFQFLTDPTNEAYLRFLIRLINVKLCNISSTSDIVIKYGTAKKPVRILQYTGFGGRKTENVLVIVHEKGDTVDLVAYITKRLKIFVQYTNNYGLKKYVVFSSLRDFSYYWFAIKNEIC